MRCTSCASNSNKIPSPSSTSLDAYKNSMGCECSPGYLTLPSAFGSSASNACLDTCMVASKAVSIHDNTQCSACNGTSVYDATSSRCQCTDAVAATEDGAVVTHRIVELYDASVDYRYQTCQVCEPGTAVILAQKTTAGVTYYPDPLACQSCPHDTMHFNANYDCVCKDPTWDQVGNTLVGHEWCVGSTVGGSESSEFHSIQTEPEGLYDGTGNYDSDVVSHYYEWASYTCSDDVFNEVTDLTREQQEACQTLANLCVMQMYDTSHDVCDRYDNILSSRNNGEYMDGWMKGLPWLYYDDDANTIREDRSIGMTVSFMDMIGYTNVLKYKLVKFTLDGKFVGVEDLSTHFSYCKMSSPDTNTGGGTSTSTKFLKFGTSERIEYKCDMDLLADEEMFFYDMYLVDDNIEQDCDEELSVDGQCLYPVPVLIRNLRDGSLTPNLNFAVEEEVDDVFTRRFFLFDNQSGRENGQVEAIRYAKTIILQNTVQDVDPSKIFPPTLTIEYAERQRASWTERELDETAALMAVDTVLFKSEYTMLTVNFWDSIDICIGFVSAIACVVWLIRVRNWQTRNQRIGAGADSGEANSTMYMVHMVMLAAHTFVLVFFPFVFILCAYWFVFFKLQETVFVMMPANNEFYLVNEYFFYETFFHALFWVHTFYMLYTIYMQCDVDIFLVDWEKPKSKQSDVSIWRTLMVANVWNEMQTMRKTSIEVTLVGMGFFLVGLDLQNNATMQPDLDDVSDGYINMALRFCNTAWFFFVMFMLQWIANFVFFERYYREPRSQIFVDLCTMAKISVFIMDEPYHGFYLHCRSPYEFADGSMQNLAEQLKKEESGLTTDRGLDAAGAPRGCQTFELFTSPTFRGQFEKIYSALNQNNSAALAQDTGRLGHMVGRAGGKGRAPPPERMVSALKELNGFLQSFVEQSPPPQREELKRIVREPPFFDQIIGTPPADIRSQNAKCVFYPDQKSWLKDNSFLNVTFMGIEWDLQIHNILSFNMFDMFFGNVAVSIMLTYMVHLFFVWLRGSFGQGNLANKTLVDDKFLI